MDVTSSTGRMSKLTRIGNFTLVRSLAVHQWLQPRSVLLYDIVLQGLCACRTLSQCLARKMAER